MKISRLAVLFLLITCGNATAQDDCDYETCALRLKLGWSTKLVAGVEEREIKGIGMFPSEKLIDFFGERSEKAADSFKTYRSRQKTGSMMIWGGLLMIIGGAVVAGEDADLGLGLALAGLGINFGGIVVTIGAPDHLSQAIWEYNRTLAMPPPPAGD